MGKKLTEKFENGNIEEGYYYVWEDEFFDTIDFLFKLPPARSSPKAGSSSRCH